jgi:hypothetical protein
MEETFEKIVKVQLSDGTLLELQMAPRLEATLRSKYNLSTDEELSGDLLKEFLLAALGRAEVLDDV